MCGGGGGAPQEQVEMPEVTQDQINQAISLPDGFKAEPVPINQGGGYRIVEPGGAVYQQATNFGELVAGANQLNTIAGSGDAMFDPESNQFISNRSGQAITMDTIRNQPMFQEQGMVGGRRVAVPGAGENVPGITELAYGLMAEGLELPEQRLAGFAPDQQTAFDIARSGVGSYKPFLDRATGLTQEGVASLQQSLGATRDLAGQIPGQVSTGRAALTRAAGRVEDFAGQGAGALQQSAADAMRFTEQGVQDAREAADRSYLAGEQARALAADVTGRARSLQAPLEGSLGQTTDATRGIAATGMSGADLASARARGSTAEAQQALQEASRLGQATALQGITQLAGTGTQFSPTQADAFMSEYEDAAVQQALADIARQGELQEQQIGAQAVQSGAFGGSRQAVAEQELARNILEQQGRTAAQMRAAGYESAAQRAQQAFEQSQSRQQNVAQLTGQLGQIGTQSAAGAAEAAGRLGLSAEELAQRSALQGAQLGMSAEQFAAANAQAIAQTGLNIEQLAAQTGMNAQQLAGQMAGQAGQLGISAGQLGIQGSQAAGAMGAQGAQMQMQGAESAGNLGLQSSQLGLSGIQAGLGAQQQAAGLGQGIAGLGQQMVGLGQAGQQMNLQDVNTMLTTGGAQQRQAQAALDTAYQNQYQRAMQPYQQLAFASDIITGAPSGQASTMSQPGPSIGSQVLGIGMAAPAIYQGWQGMMGGGQ